MNSHKQRAQLAVECLEGRDAPVFLGPTSYVANHTAGTVSLTAQPLPYIEQDNLLTARMTDITDGTSSTLLSVDTSDLFVQQNVDMRAAGEMQILPFIEQDNIVKVLSTRAARF